MNIDERLNNYKEKLGFTYWSDFGKACDVGESFINGIKNKKTIEEYSSVNLANLKKVTDYLGITINEFLSTDEIIIEKSPLKEIKYLNECDDIGDVLSELQIIVQQRKDIKIDRMPMNSESKQVFNDILDILRVMTKQKL